MRSSILALGAVLALTTAPMVSAQTAQELANDEATTGDVLVYGMGNSANRYSPLDQINKDTVKRLVPVWNYSLADNRGQETHPLIYNGVMYVTTHNATIAIDAATGKQVWKTAVDYPAETPRVACCGIVNRGAAIYEGKVFRTTLDAQVQALDMATGEELWKSKSIDFKLGHAMTVAPQIAGGKVIVGVSGGEYGVRGYIEAYEPDSGERAWRTYTIPAPGEPGSETWKDGGDAWKHGGAPAWLTGSYDPELDLVYWGTGNAASWNAGIRPGDNLYTSTILAMRPATGEIVWHFQTSPNDPFDHDGTNELVLTELNGEKVVMQASRNGFFYVLNRENGELVAANTFVDDVNWAKGIDMETGRPITTEIYTNAVAGEQVTYWPSALGGKNWNPMAYDPERQLAFANTLKIGLNYKAVEPDYRPGVMVFGADISWEWPEGDRGILRAIDPLTGKHKWENGVGIPRLGGAMATGGGLVFTGRQTGELEAFDSDTGELLWEFQAGSGFIGQPVTWEQDGRQYVSMAVGGGAVYALFAGDERLANVPAGGSIWTFALLGE